MAREFEAGNWRELSASLQDEDLVAMPSPPLIWQLAHFRKEKGADLTEEEVLDYRNRAVCIVMRRDAAAKMALGRGYDDIDPRDVWADWQAFLRDQETDETQ